MSIHKRNAFTLVELLVVITIIGALMSMLLPAVGGAIARAERLRCESSQHSIAQAFQTYNATYSKLPGYVNAVGTDASGNRKMASWVVPLLPHIDQNQLWNEWSKTTGGSAPQLEAFVCASDQVGADLGAISFVVNAGYYNPSLPAIPNDQNVGNGVFLDGFNGSANISLNFLSGSTADGTSNTLMVGENIQAQTWLATDASKYHFGFVWQGTSGPPPNPANLVNGDPGATVLDWDHARLSSNHQGGVVVAFCDARTHFLTDTVDYNVLRQLMTSSSQQSSQSNKILLDSTQY